MKIVVATALYPPEIENLSTYSQDIASFLAEKHQVKVLAYANEVEESSGFQIHTISKKQPLWLRLIKYTIKLFSLSRKADIIYVQNSVAVGLPAIIVKILSGKNVIINFSEDEAWKRAINLSLTTKSYNDFIRSSAKQKLGNIMKLQAFILRNASAVIVPSKTLGEIISDVYGLREQKVFVNYIAEHSEQKLPFDIDKNNYQIFTAAPLLEYAGLEATIKTLAVLIRNFPEAKLLISGDGPAKESLKRLASDLEISDKVDFLGKISLAQNWYLYKSSGVYVYNFKANDFSHNISTAWLAELPVVGADTEVAREMSSDHGAILFFKPNDSRDMSQKITNIFEAQELKNKLILSARENLQKRFSWSAHLAILENIFQSFK
ncbi:hypothetical protein C0580_03755 [Candidatus Parcubacteria bacterium]|nr:MAG: hypothetical protein C0580_03755 [Candidatus Parcubacteria bacterium]